jgi:hypothetical protein
MADRVEHGRNRHQSKDGIAPVEALVGLDAKDPNQPAEVLAGQGEREKHAGEQSKDEEESSRRPPSRGACQDCCDCLHHTRTVVNPRAPGKCRPPPLRTARALLNGRNQATDRSGRARHRTDFPGPVASPEDLP